MHINNQIKISVIIPVFNVERYLSRCLDSVINQTFKDFECILIDDASSDDSLIICKKYASKDNRFKVIIKTKNEGLPKARKTGLDNAMTSFITYVDSDDWLEINAIELLYKKKEESNADIVRANFKYYFNNYTKILNMNYSSYNDADPLICFFMNNNNSLCATLYKKYLFDRYIIPEINMGEDAITNVQIFSNVDHDKICYISDVIYNYDCRTSSISRTNHNKYLSFIDAYDYKYIFFIEKYLHEIGKDTKAIKNAFTFYYIYNVIFHYLFNYKNTSQIEISFFYNNYWKKCDSKYLFNGYERKIIPIYNLSIKLGRLYIYIIKITNIIKNIYYNINFNGLFIALKYYFNIYKKKFNNKYNI